MLGAVLNDTRATNPGTGSIPCSPMSARNCRAAANEGDQIDHRDAALQDLSSQPILGCYEPFRVHFGYS